jgi:heme-degrading monooxygenase HmoA
MFARVTLFDIDTLRISVDDALELFKKLVVPEATKREGYKGMYVIRTPEGKGMIISFWSSKEAAMTGVLSGYYDDQVKKFLTFYRSAPGREHYDVVLEDMPGKTRV